MTPAEARALLQGAIPGSGGTWADLGAGEGVFTRALVQLLGPGARVFAVDRDAKALDVLERWSAEANAGVVTVKADLAGPFELPGMRERDLDGILLANALHYVRDPEHVLARLGERLRPGGTLVLVEYDRHRGNPWVPHPIPIAKLPALLAAAGFSEPRVTATRPSLYGGNVYVAAAELRARPRASS
jgi:SAM-dependent methyltransferase